MTTGTPDVDTGTRLRAGLIGLSWIATDPAGDPSDAALGTAPPYSHASAIDAVGGIDVVVGCDLNPTARDRFVERWGARWPGVETTDSVQDLLARDLDLVVVATPDHLHGTFIRMAIEAGVRTIFSEKPFTTDLGEADDLLELIGDTGSVVAINHTWRWRPPAVEARATIRRNEIGPLSQIIIEAGGPRAMLFRNLSHFLDLANFFSDSTPEWVIAELEEGSAEYGLSYAGDGGHDPDRDPGANILIGYVNGVRAFVNGLKSSVGAPSVHLSCSDGRIVLDALGERIVAVARTNDGTPGTATGPIVRRLNPRFTRSGMEAGIAELVAARTRDRTLTSSAATARDTVAVLDATLRSHAAHSARVDVKPTPSKGNLVPDMTASTQREAPT